jgi:hypothetical protein
MRRCRHPLSEVESRPRTSARLKDQTVPPVNGDSKVANTAAACAEPEAEAATDDHDEEAEAEAKEEAEAEAVAADARGVGGATSFVKRRA